MRDRLKYSSILSDRKLPMKISRRIVEISSGLVLADFANAQNIETDGSGSNFVNAQNTEINGSGSNPQSVLEACILIGVVFTFGLSTIVVIFCCVDKSEDDRPVFGNLFSKVKTGVEEGEPTEPNMTQFEPVSLETVEYEQDSLVVKKIAEKSPEEGDEDESTASDKKGVEIKVLRWGKKLEI